MENKDKMMEAIMIANTNNRNKLTGLLDEFDIDKMLCDYIKIFSNRNDRIERAEAFWSDISDSRIERENIKTVEDAKMISEIGRVLDKLKKLIEEE